MADATPLPVLGTRRPRVDGGALWESIVNGPVRSRRLGISLGLNLTPARSKLCNFNCPYCECGFNTARAPDGRWPSPDEVGHALRRALERSGAAPPAWITFAGNGEPTLHPRFAVVVDRVLEARAELAPGARVGVLTNGLTADRPPVAAALRRLDARMIKLDPGPPERVNGVRYDAAALAATCRALAPVLIQAMVARGEDWDGSSDAALAAWLPLLQSADPEVVHLYSLDRPPADRRVQNVPRERLEQMAIAIRRALPRAQVLWF
jgi:wyosine [tRNA(Phe)-imidazoG37] synthetase (radical SAM superfamily)